MARETDMPAEQIAETILFSSEDIYKEVRKLGGSIKKNSFARFLQRKKSEDLGCPKEPAPQDTNYDVSVTFKTKQ